MADQIATRYGILDRKLSHAALQTIVLTTADAINVLDEAHQWLRRMGVPDTHADHQTPRQRWEQLLRNLFPASIILVDPHGSASPDLVNLPADSDDDERAVRRLLNAAAAFLLAETTTLGDAVELSQHWADPGPAGPDDGLDPTEKILSRATRASRTLLDHAESGRWRDLLAAHARQPRTPASPTYTPTEQEQRTTLVNLDVGPGKSGMFVRLVCEHAAAVVKASMQRGCIGCIDLTRSTPLASGFARLCAETFSLSRSVEYSRCITVSTVAGEIAACAERYIARFAELAATPIAARDFAYLLASMVRDDAHRLGATSLVDVAGHTLAAPWHDLAVPSWHIRPPWPLSVSDMMHPILPGSSRPEIDDIFEMSRPLLIAASQMSSAEVATRLAGLSMLETFGQVNPSQRQTVVNVLCSYLNPAVTGRCTTPPNPPPPAPPLDEWRVRAAVQTALARHLRPGTNPAHPPGTYWPDLDLDLTNAVLTDLDLAGCYVHTVRFTGARFRGDTSFTNVRFAGAVFDGADFEGDVVFERVAFVDDTRFRQTTFNGVAVFEDVRFDGDARFDAARFVGRVVFTRSVFGEDVRFSETEFSGDAVFDRVMFTGLARFGQARFFDGARFRETRFNRDQDDKRAWDLGAVLLEQEPCWVRTDTPATVAPRRVWPAGWTVQPTLDQPTGGHGGRWGRLVPTQQPRSRRHAAPRF